jgi:hypothetical protein
VNVANGSTADLTAPCEADEIVVAGGFDGDSGINAYKAFTEAGSGAGGAGGRYKVSVKATGNGNKATAYAVCMKITNV